MPIILEILGAIVFVTIFVLGIRKAVEWYNRRQKREDQSNA